MKESVTIFKQLVEEDWWNISKIW